MTSVDLEPQSMKGFLFQCLTPYIRLAPKSAKGFFFNVLCMEHPNTITPTKVVLAITYSLHMISSTHIEGFFF
jgi:hypothetical protein